MTGRDESLAGSPDDAVFVDLAAATFDTARRGLRRRGRGRMIPTLDRMRAMVELLGDPQHACPVVHVTGTNGKTSVTRMVVTLLAALGLRAGSFTSPHLRSEVERIQVALEPVTEQEFARAWGAVEAVARIVDADARAAAGEGEVVDTVTYFEMTAAMAMWLFADLAVDVAVVEVGMGGRWDATNVADGTVAVLTPVDVDHSELGDDAATVAGEKVGIIKPDARVVLGRQPDDVLAVVQAAAADAQAPVMQWGDDLEVVARTVAVGGQQCSLRVGDRTIDGVFLPLHGAHQADNAAVALAAVAALLGPAFDAVDDDVIRAGFGQATSPGRLEVVATEPTVVLDGGHNPHGARAAAVAFDEAFTFRNVVLVVGALADKDIAGIVAAWRGVVDHVVVTSVQSPRTATAAATADVAVQVFADTGIVVEQADDPTQALQMARGVAGPGDGIIVTGSLYLVAALRDELVDREQ